MARAIAHIMALVLWSLTNYTQGKEPALQYYNSYLDYAMDRFNTNRSLGVPIFDLPSERPASFPLAIVIGTQKGGTQNVMKSLGTHPLVTEGEPQEVHFFDRPVGRYPWQGEWPGDSKDSILRPATATSVLRSYAEVATAQIKFQGRDNEVPGVESTPLYMLHPLAPYRMRMIYPQARIIVLLRDPTDRYFSSLRMLMCLEGHRYERDFEDWFHTPGRAQEYIKQAEREYTPYTPICTGVNATAADLAACNTQIWKRNPLHRGIYADQLERWFRVFDPAQILIVSSSDLFVDMPSVLANIANHVGLPEFDFQRHEEFQNESLQKCHPKDEKFFVSGGRYDQMLKDEDVFREFYRSHNRRLYDLIGRDLGWD